EDAMPTSSGDDLVRHGSYGGSRGAQRGTAWDQTDSDRHSGDKMESARALGTRGTGSDAASKESQSVQSINAPDQANGSHSETAAGQDGRKVPSTPSLRSRRKETDSYSGCPVEGCNYFRCHHNLLVTQDKNARTTGHSISLPEGVMNADLRMLSTTAATVTT